MNRSDVRVSVDSVGSLTSSFRYWCFVFKEKHPTYDLLRNWMRAQKVDEGMLDMIWERLQTKGVR